MKKILLFALLLISFRASSTTLTVSSLGDSGAGTLRDLIGSAASGDTIDFAVAGTITLTSGEINISRDMVILSSGAANLTLSGNSTNRIFSIASGTIYIQSVSFENGVVTGEGGAIQNSSADLVTFDKCVFNSCSATTNGGAVVSDGASLNIFDCTFTNNQATLYGGGLRLNDGQVLIMSSTFNGNSSGFSGGGIHVVAGFSTIVNSTLSGNNAVLNGGGFEGNMDLMNCTITGNSAANGGGASPASSSFQNCIIYGNSATSGPDIKGLINSNGNNLIGDTATTGGFLLSDIINQDPLLDILNLNGGFTATHALMSSSPCIDAGACQSAPRVDQRDIARTGYPDMGAYEFGGTPFATNIVSQELCTGDSLLFGTQTIDTAGVYTEIFSTMEGCDSTVEMTITLIPVYNETASNTICSVDSLVFGGQVLTSTGVYTETFTSALACDSVVELTLTVISPDLTVVQNGETLTASGTATSYQWLDCTNNQALTGETNQDFTATVNGQYAVAVTENGCSDTSACYTISTVGIIENVSEANVKVYPTSTSGEININFASAEQNILVKVVNLLGEEVFQNSYSGQNHLLINLADRPAGNYFVQIQTEQHSYIHRIIKK